MLKVIASRFWKQIWLRYKFKIRRIFLIYEKENILKDDLFPGPWDEIRMWPENSKLKL